MKELPIQKIRELQSSSKFLGTFTKDNWKEAFLGASKVVHRLDLRRPANVMICSRQTLNKLFPFLKNDFKHMISNELHFNLEHGEEVGTLLSNFFVGIYDLSNESLKHDSDEEPIILIGRIADGIVAFEDEEESAHGGGIPTINIRISGDPKHFAGNIIHLHRLHFTEDEEQ